MESVRQSDKVVSTNISLIFCFDRTKPCSAFKTRFQAKICIDV